MGAADQIHRQMRWEQPLEQLQQGVEASVHIDRFQRLRLFATHRQQLTTQLHAAICGRQYVRNDFTLRLAQVILTQEMRIADDDLEQVVEVVGDTAGQKPEALQLLCLKQSAVQLRLLSLCAGALFVPAQSSGGHAALCSDRHQDVQIFGRGRLYALVTHRTDAQHAERHVYQ